jgi:hypothetical protein
VKSSKIHEENPPKFRRIGMTENDYIVAGYSFSDVHDFKEAKREEETIEFIKANTDLNDINKAVKLYHKLVERRTLKTVVGFAFLKELQERITKEGIIKQENMPCIKVIRDGNQLPFNHGEINHEVEKKLQAKVEDYRIRLRNSRIISAFLLAIIIIMILISIFSDRSIFVNYENKLINKYSTWEEDLNTRQKALEEKEKLQSED